MTYAVGILLELFEPPGVSFQQQASVNEMQEITQGSPHGECMRGQGSTPLYWALPFRSCSGHNRYQKQTTGGLEKGVCRARKRRQPEGFLTTVAGNGNSSLGRTQVPERGRRSPWKCPSCCCDSAVKTSPHARGQPPLGLL